MTIQQQILDKIENLNHDMNNRVLYYDIIEAIIKCDLEESSIGTIDYGFLNREDLIQGQDDLKIFLGYISGKSFTTSQISELGDEPVIWFSEYMSNLNQYHFDILTIKDYVNWFINSLRNFEYEEIYFKRLSILLL